MSAKVKRIVVKSEKLSRKKLSNFANIMSKVTMNTKEQKKDSVELTSENFAFVLSQENVGDNNKYYSIYKPFFENGEIRNYHISECEDIPFEELSKCDYYKNAYRSEQLAIYDAKCGFRLAIMKRTDTEWYFDSKKAELLELQQLFRFWDSQRNKYL